MGAPNCLYFAGGALILIKSFTSHFPDGLTSGLIRAHLRGAAIVDGNA